MLPYLVTMSREGFGLYFQSSGCFLRLDSFGCFSCSGFSHRRVCVSELQHTHPDTLNPGYSRQVAEVATNLNLDDAVDVLSRPSIEILL